MKVEFPDHPKFLRLQYLLKESVPLVLGCMECLWRRCYQLGTDYIGDELDVEVCAAWPGERGRFVAAVIDAKLVDKDANGIHRCHDLWDHAPLYVKKRMARRGTAPDETKEYSGIKVPKEPALNEFATALAEVCGIDTSVKRNRKPVRELAEELEAAEPPYTTADLRAFACRYHEFCPYDSALLRERPTLNEVRKNIGMLRAKPAPEQKPTKRTATGNKSAAETRQDYAKRQADDL